MADDPLNFGAAGPDPFDKVIGIFKDPNPPEPKKTGKKRFENSMNSQSGWKFNYGNLTPNHLAIYFRNLEVGDFYCELHPELDQIRWTFWRQSSWLELGDVSREKAASIFQSKQRVTLTAEHVLMKKNKAVGDSVFLGCISQQAAVKEWFLMVFVYLRWESISQCSLLPVADKVPLDPAEIVEHIIDLSRRTEEWARFAAICCARCPERSHGLNV